MAGAGIAVKGISKILRKGLRKSPVFGKYTRGTPTKAALRGKIKDADKYRKLLDKTKAQPKTVKKKPLISKFEAGVGVGGTGVLATQGYLKFLKAEATKEAKAKETKKDKLKKATEEHKKKTKEKRKKYGKHHG